MFMRGFNDPRDPEHGYISVFYFYKRTQHSHMSNKFIETQLITSRWINSQSISAQLLDLVEFTRNGKLFPKTNGIVQIFLDIVWLFFRENSALNGKKFSRPSWIFWSRSKERKPTLNPFRLTEWVNLIRQRVCVISCGRKRDEIQLYVWIHNIVHIFFRWFNLLTCRTKYSVAMVTRPTLTFVHDKTVTRQSDSKERGEIP